MTVAGVCLGCGRAFDWVEIPPGAAGVTCPRCQLAVPVPRPVPLVPTFPAPAPSPAGMAIQRIEAPAPPAVQVDEGPFRTSARPYVERRDGDTYEIDFPRIRGGPVRPGAVVWTGLWLTLAFLGICSFTTAAVVGLPMTVWSVLARRRRRRVRIDATTISASGSPPIPRRAVTHIFVVGVANDDGPLWQVRVRAGAADVLLATSPLIDDADAIASLLATELGLPTWVPQANRGLPT
ncbi:MAG: hypothetical protein R3B06_14255 [Kofleriaceae bacterium]